MGVLLYELGELYSANRRGVPCALPEPMSFRGYAQREAVEQRGPQFAVAEEYWVKQFSDCVPVLELPSDRPRPARRTYAGSHRACSLKPELAAALRRFSAERNCTTFTTLLALFEVLLHRLSGQDDIVIGAPAAGQVMGGARYLVGHCANLLPLRSRFDARQTFSDYLTGIRQTVLDAFEHQQYPFSSLIRKLNLPRDPNRMPLANVTFNVGRSRGNLNFHGLAVEVARNPKGFVNFDLNFNVMETEAGVWLNCYYSTELFDDTTVARLLGQYQFLIEKAVSDGEQGLGELPLLSEAERRQLLVERNETAAEPPSNACIHELFEAQVARTPQATALICEAERLTCATV